MVLNILNKQFTICQIDSIAQVNFNDDFYFIGKTDEELSLVCSVESVPSNVKNREDGWLCLKVEGVLDFSLVGILAKIASILANENISIFVVSTFNTDYVLIKETEKSLAITALKEQGYTFTE